MSFPALDPQALPPVLTARQAADLLHVHFNTVKKACQLGKLPAFKVGARWRINRDDLLAFMRTATYLSSDGHQSNGEEHSALAAALTRAEQAEAEVRRLAVRIGELESQRELGGQGQTMDETLQTLIDTLPAGVVVADAHGAIILANAAANGFFGGQPTGDADSPQGGYLMRRVDGSEYAPDELPLPRALRGQSARHEEILIQPGAGEPVVGLVDASPLRDPQGRIVGAVAAITDITGRKLAETQREAALAALHETVQALEESRASLAQELAATQQLQHISTRLIEQDNLDALYGQILDAAMTLLHSDAGSMQALDDEGQELRLLAWRGFAPESAAFWQRVSVESSSTCGAALSRGERVLAPDAETCDFMAGTDDLHYYRLSGIRAVQSTPLISRNGRMVGMLSTHWREPYQPPERELQLLDVLARQAADLLERAQVESQRKDALAALGRARDELEQRVQERTRELSASHEELRTYSRRLVEAIENERRNLARELHDQTGQSMSALNLSLGQLRREVNGHGQHAARLEEMGELIEGVMDELHRLAVNLRPSSLDRYGLVPALEQLLNEFRKLTDVEVAFDASGLDNRPERLPEQVETALYRIVQESFTNIARHAHANMVSVVLQLQDDRVQVIVEDDGSGFDVSEALRRGRLGLPGMRERAEMLGGSLEIESSPGHGTVVYARVPIRPAEVEAFAGRALDHWPAGPAAASGHSIEPDARLAEAAELARAKALSDALVEITAVLVSQDSVDALLDSVLAASAEAVGCDYALVLLRKHSDAGDHWLVQGGYRLGAAQVGQRLSDAQAPLSVAIERSGEVIVANDIPTDHPQAGHFREWAVRSGAVIPLVAGGRFLGNVFYVRNAGGGPFTTTEVEFLKRLTALISLSLQNLQLRETETQQRRLAEQASASLAEERDRLRALLVNLPDEVWFCDAEGNVIAANPAAVRGLGLDALGDSFQPFPEWPALEIRTPDGQPRRREDAPLLRALRGERVERQEEMVRHLKTGEWRYRQASGEAIHDAAGQTVGAVVVVRDITAQKQTEAELRNGEARLRAVLNQAPLAIVFTGPSGEILFRNAMFDRLWGRPPYTTTARTYSDVYRGYHLDGRPVASEEWPGARAVLNGEVIEDEYYEMVQADGRRIICWYAARPIRDQDGDVVGGVVLFRDVTEERRTHEALRASEQVHAFHSAILQSVRDPLWVSDHDLRIVYWNDAATAMFGWTADEVLGRNTGELFQTQFPGSTRDVELARLLQTGEFQGEILMRHKDGRQVLAEASSRLVRGPDGEVVRLVNTVRDITERKQAEEHQAFLLRFSDALRAQPDEQSIKDQAVSMLAEHLALDRCYISEVFEQQGFSTVGPEQIRPDLPPMTGVFQLADYPETMLQLATQPMVIDDAANDLRFSDAEKLLLAGWHLGALLVAPLRKGPHQVIWALAAAMTTPRDWTEGERLLLEEVAERTWAGVERKRAESQREAAHAAMRASEEKYRGLFETMDEGFALCQLLRGPGGKASDYRLLETNPAYERQTGMTAVEIREHLHREFDPGRNQQMLELCAKVVDSGQPVHFEYFNQELARWFNVGLFPRPDDRYAAIFRDITERKQAEADLAADLRDTQLLRDLGARLTSEADTQVLYQEIMAAAIALTHADAGTVQILDRETHDLALLAIQGIPPVFMEHFGRVEAGSGTSCGLALATGQRAFVDYDAPGAPDPDGSLRMHVEAGFQSGQSTPLVARSGVPIGMLSTHWRTHHRPSERELRFLDLLARQAADLIDVRQAQEEALQREAYRRNSEILESIGDAFFAMDAEWRLIYVNHRAEEVFGHSREELLGTVFWDLWPNYQETATYMHCMQALAEQRPVSFENFSKHVQGWFEATVYPRADGGVAVYFRDISERKQAEARTAAAQEAIRQQSERLALLHETDRLILAARAPTEIAREAIAKVQRATGSVRAAVHVFDAVIEEAEIIAVAGLDSPHTPAGTRLPASKFWMVDEIRAGRIATVADLAELPDDDPLKAARLSEGMRSATMIPMLAHNDVIGQLIIYLAQPGGLAAEELAWVTQVSDSLAVAIQNARLREQLEADQAQLQALSHRLVERQERERARLADSLYNEATQVLAALKIHLARPEGRAMAEYTAETQAMLDRVMRDLHHMATDLRPASLDRLGLLPAMQQYAEEWGREQGVSVQFLAPEAKGFAIGVDAETALYRVVQEALANVAQHAQATGVAIIAHLVDGRFSVVLEDDGVGFDPAAAARRGALGLRSMKERVEAVGGRLTVDSLPGGGTTLMVEVPVDTRQRSQQPDQGADR